ncbi:MAG: hypothetical protein Q7N87_01710 [Candidatus Uhrbacteria bacterium]|nr:hypothetical protein [Candidatus Uhrbacteria bacterium]
MKLKYVLDKKYDKQFVGMSSKIVRDNFDDIYKNSQKYLKYTQQQYQMAWDKIGQKFFRYIAKETGYEWFYPEYKCVVSVANQGISNWGCAPIIIRGWKENPYGQRRITAHELILSHYFEIYKRHYSEFGLSDNQVWALAEIAAFALTSLTKTAKNFWPWDFTGYYTNHNYPQIVSLQNRLKKVFIERKNFDEYMLIGIKMVKKFEDIKP